MKRQRPLSELLSAARAELATNTSILVYEMVGVREVWVQAWCAVCDTRRRYDLLVDKHQSVPDFQICTYCGNGVAADALAVAV